MGVQSAQFTPDGRLFSLGRDDATLGLARSPFSRGDLNCDGLVNFDDIDPFVLALSDPAAYALQYPDCDILNGDANGDGVVNFDDINAFVALLSGA